MLDSNESRSRAVAVAAEPVQRSRVSRSSLASRLMQRSTTYAAGTIRELSRRRFSAGSSGDFKTEAVSDDLAQPVTIRSRRRH